MGHPALELQAAGFEIGLLDDGRVLVKPKSRLTEETCQFIKAHKPELVDYLRRQAVNDTAPTDATKPTKPPETEQNPSFVGFVAYPSAHFGKNDGVNDATAKPDSAAATPEQSDSFVGFVAYPSPHFEKNEDEPKPTDNPTPYPVDWHQAHAAYQRHHITCPVCIAAGKGYGPMCDEGQRLWDAYEAAPMPEFGKAKRVRTPSQAPAPQTPPRMAPRSGAEIVRMIGLHRRALAVGLPNNSATGKVLDELMDAPDMGSCFACGHLRGAEPERWRCAGAGHELSGSPLARAFVVQLHRCPSYQPPEGTPT